MAEKPGNPWDRATLKRLRRIGRFKYQSRIIRGAGRPNFSMTQSPANGDPYGIPDPNLPAPTTAAPKGRRESHRPITIPHATPLLNDSRARPTTDSLSGAEEAPVAPFGIASAFGPADSWLNAHKPPAGRISSFRVPIRAGKFGAYCNRSGFLRALAPPGKLACPPWGGLYCDVCGGYI